MKRRRTVASQACSGCVYTLRYDWQLRRTRTRRDLCRRTRDFFLWTL